MGIQRMDKTDRELLIDVHGMVSRVDERTRGLPERIAVLEIQVEGQRRDVSLIKRLGTGALTIIGAVVAASVGLVVKLLNGGN